jgi:hypothetical protein
MLTERLSAGEEKNDYLFSTLSEAHTTLSMRAASCVTVELMCVARILFSLGYLSSEALHTTIFTHAAYADEHMAEAENLRSALLSSVNKALAETQL